MLLCNVHDFRHKIEKILWLNENANEVYIKGLFFEN